MVLEELVRIEQITLENSVGDERWIFYHCGLVSCWVNILLGPPCLGAKDVNMINLLKTQQNQNKVLIIDEIILFFGLVDNTLSQRPLSTESILGVLIQLFCSAITLFYIPNQD